MKMNGIISDGGGGGKLMWLWMWMLMLVLVLVGGDAEAAVYIVGGEKNGWTFSVRGWEQGKNFKAGDILVFRYRTDLHNVVKVDKASFDACRVPPNAPTLATGNDQVLLPAGPNYFICGVPGHCGAGVRVSAFAT